MEKTNKVVFFLNVSTVWSSGFLTPCEGLVVVVVVVFTCLRFVFFWLVGCLQRNPFEARLPFFLPQEIYCPWGRYIHVPGVWIFWEDGDVTGTQ